VRDWSRAMLRFFLRGFGRHHDRPAVHLRVRLHRLGDLGDSCDQQPVPPPQRAFAARAQIPKTTTGMARSPTTSPTVFPASVFVTATLVTSLSATPVEGAAPPDETAPTRLSPRTMGDLSVMIVPSVRVTRMEEGRSASTNRTGVGVPTCHVIEAGCSIEALRISLRGRLMAREASPDPTVPTRLSPFTTGDRMVKFVPLVSVPRMDWGRALSTSCAGEGAATTCVEVQAGR
jgi:hypothetical protein